jgi:hypothetical protein
MQAPPLFQFLPAALPAPLPAVPLAAPPAALPAPLPAVVFGNDAFGNPVTMNGVPFGILNTLPSPSPALVHDDKTIMYKFFCDDSSHDHLTDNTTYARWPEKYKECVQSLFPGVNLDNLGIDPADRSRFKSIVTDICEENERRATALYTANKARSEAHAAISSYDSTRQGLEYIRTASLAAVADFITSAESGFRRIVNQLMPNNPDTIVQLVPRGTDLTGMFPTINCQNVDNFTATAEHGFGQNVLITPGRFYDACSRTGQTNVLQKLQEWWVNCVTGRSSGVYAPFFIDLVAQGIVTLPNSYLFVSLQSDTTGPFLLFVIRLGGIEKTIKISVDQDNMCAEQDLNGHYLLVGGRSLGQCFFKEIYYSNSTTGSSIPPVHAVTVDRLTPDYLKGVNCLQVKRRKRKEKPNITVATNILSLIQSAGGKQRPKPKSDEGDTYNGYSHNIEKLQRLLTEDVNLTTIGAFMLIAKFLGDELVMATTPPNSIVSTSDFMLCYNCYLHKKNTLFSFTRNGFSSTHLFMHHIPTISGTATPAAAAAATPSVAPDATFLRAANAVVNIQDLYTPAASNTAAPKKAGPKKAAANKAAANKAAAKKAANPFVFKKKLPEVKKKVKKGVLKKLFKKRNFTGISKHKIKGQGGGAMKKFDITDDKLDMSPSDIIKSIVPSNSLKKIALIWKGKNISAEEERGKTLREIGVSLNDPMYIVTDDTTPIQTDNTSKKDTGKVKSYEKNDTYSLLVTSFKSMIQDFIKNLEDVVKFSGGKYVSGIQIEEEDSTVYSLNDTRNFAGRISNIISFYKVIYAIPDDELVENLAETNIFRALELITPVSPFIPKDKTPNVFVFLLCPDWFTSVMYAKSYLGKFLTSPETTNIEQYVTDDRNLHTAFIKELNRLPKDKYTPIDVVSSRDIPSINSFEVYLKCIVRVIAPFVTSERAFEEEFGCSVDEICDLLGISTDELGIKFTVEDDEEEEQGEQQDKGAGQEEQQTQEEEGETRELTIKKICSKIPGILSTLIVAYILRETVELELLKVVVEDGQNNIYLIKSIHQLLKKIITYYGTFITAPEIIVSFIQGIDFKNNTLSFPGNYAQLYECMGTYDEIGDEITNDTMYNNFEDISLADITFISNEILKKPEIASMSDETELDETMLDGIVQKYVNEFTQQLDQEQEQEQEQQPQQSINPLGLQHKTIAPEPETVTVKTGGKSNRISNPKQNTKYRKRYKKFVSKYIVKKKRKSNKKNNKNKTRKNRKLPKPKPKSKSKYANKTLKNKKRKTKPNKHKSKQNNKKTKTNYYNYYKHNKTLKH